MFTIIAENAQKAAELRAVFAAADRARAKEIKAAQKAAHGARYVVIDAGYPAIRYLVWDCEANDNLRGEQLSGAHPWFVSKAKAQKIADKYNRLHAISAAA